MEVIDAATGRTIASMIKPFDGMEQWLTFDFDDVAMQRSVYLIAVSNVVDNMTYFWKYMTDCYGQGYAIMNYQEQADIDLSFSVYSYDTNSDGDGGGSGNPGGTEPEPSLPAPHSGGGSSGATPSPVGISPSTQKPPAAVTSSAILPPTNLSAKDAELDYGGTINLNWTASATADIDGYKIFRRAEGDNEYIEILRLPKTFTKFTDPWATKDKTYYYKIRAYKGSSESADSNIAFATSKDDMTGITRDIVNDFKKNNKGGILGEAGFLMIIPIVIVLMIIGLFILGLWVLFHKKKVNAPPVNPSTNPPKKKSLLNRNRR